MFSSSAAAGQGQGGGSLAPEATSTLVDAWGHHFVDLNHGNLRQKDWQEVADTVNLRYGHTKKTRRTDVQCKNRIDTLKKKYKVEKAKVSESNGSVTNSWSFFSRLDYLIRSTTTPAKKALSSPLAVPLVYRKPLSGRNYSTATTAATTEKQEEEEEEKEEEDKNEVEGMRRLARVIERFGEMYKRIEEEKYRRMIELEKQMMQFAKDLEVQRIELFMDTQVRATITSQSVPGRNIVLVRPRTLGQTNPKEHNGLVPMEGDEEIFEEKAVCKVCFDILKEENILKTECKCSIALIHEECAANWLRMRGNNNCDSCGQEVQTFPVTLVRGLSSSTQVVEREESNKCFGCFHG
ncbi:Trihelix transcription factor ASIL2 [Camellia lanceoleosa]|uniref:Trihelix transcription factor ASIL2 n=1 Tax=Camellia lanceoleosa TaxID=1840588 RepID=A0ACC0GPU2_9ERIC|nr:Trihelix transcription factor ASIL2 [Camellia lanceoleosa]